MPIKKNGTFTNEIALLRRLVDGLEREIQNAHRQHPGTTEHIRRQSERFSELAEKLEQWGREFRSHDQ